MRPFELGDVIAAEDHPAQPGSVTSSGGPQARFSWLDFRPGGVLTVNDKDATASRIFFWLYATAFAVGLVCLFVGCD
jgi:hypothetical protein